jgi:hypothetical protein
MLLAVGCAPTRPTIEFSQTRSFQRPPKAAAKIEIFFPDQPPTRPYEDVGLINAHNYNVNYSMSAMMEKLKQAAGERGLDGVRDFECASPGTVGQGTCQGKGFIYAN